MTEFNREVFKNDPFIRKLFEVIKKNHKVASHTERLLIKNIHVKDFCEEAMHFAEKSGDKPLYIHYDVSSWFKHPMGVHVKIESIVIYDDFIEYNTARIKGLHGSKSADIPTSNLN